MPLKVADLTEEHRIEGERNVKIVAFILASVSVFLTAEAIGKRSQTAEEILVARYVRTCLPTKLTWSSVEGNMSKLSLPRLPQDKTPSLSYDNQTRAYGDPQASPSNYIIFSRSKSFDKTTIQMSCIIGAEVNDVTEVKAELASRLKLGPPLEEHFSGPMPSDAVWLKRSAIGGTVISIGHMRDKTSTVVILTYTISGAAPKP